MFIFLQKKPCFYLWQLRSDTLCVHQNNYMIWQCGQVLYPVVRNSKADILRPDKIMARRSNCILQNLLLFHSKDSTYVYKSSNIIKSVRQIKSSTLPFLQWVRHSAFVVKRESCLSAWSWLISWLNWKAFKNITHLRVSKMGNHCCVCV